MKELVFDIIKFISVSILSFLILTSTIYSICYLIGCWANWELYFFWKWFIDIPTYNGIDRLGILMSVLILMGMSFVFTYSITTKSNQTKPYE